MPAHISRHPLTQHLLATLRDHQTEPQQFRQCARIIGTILALESTANLPTQNRTVRTPLEETPVQILASPLAVIPILRAGLSMLEPFLELFSDVAVGYVGLERDDSTAMASSYYCKLPDLQGKTAIVVDPMLATGGSASQAVAVVKTGRPDRIHLVCVVAAPEGIARMEQDHPDVTIFTAAIDRDLNDRKYILPGLGDYGDRLYGT